MGKRSSASGKGGRKEVDPDPISDGWDEHVGWAVQEWPEIDPAVEAIVTRVEAVDRYFVRSSVETRESLGLAHGDVKVLLRLRRSRRSHGEIARELLISTGTMTNRLDKLEAAGLVTRHPDPDDRRGVLAEMTPAGRATLDRYIEIQAGLEKRLLAGLSGEEKRQLAALLKKVIASVESEPGLVKR